METQQLINKDMTMGEIIEKYPFASEVMLSYGLHCVGCHVNPYESLENGALGHGMSDEEIASLLQELNDLVIEQHGLKIIVDPKSMEFLNGTNIDYTEGLQGSGFKLDNPNASGGCGCGKS